MIISDTKDYKQNTRDIEQRGTQMKTESLINTLRV